LASDHRVLPLLYKRLTAYAPELLPPERLAEFDQDFRLHAARGLQAAGQLIGLFKRFESAGIPVLPHKGPLLALAAYGDLGLRRFEDLDLLVNAKDLSNAIALLAEHGYHPAGELAWLSPSVLLRWTGEMTYTSPASSFPVDLHWRLTPTHYTVQIDPRFLWSSRATVTIAGTEVSTLSPEALFLLLAVHGAKHGWESIGWLADLAWLVDARLPDANRFDWERVRKLAMEAHCERPLQLAAALLERVFDVRVMDHLGTRRVANPPQINNLPHNDRLAERVVARWYNSPMESLRSTELFSFARAIARRKRDVVAHLFGLIFHPTEIDWRTRRLPEGLFWMYGPLRVLRLVRKYGRR